jgi:hypothetical protein
MSDAHTEDREQSIANLFRELSQETAGLVREELASLRDEARQQARQLGAGAGMMAGAGLLGLGAFGTFTAALVALLGRGRTGRGALLVTLLYGGGAGALAMRARERLRDVAASDAPAAAQRDVEVAVSGAREGVERPAA